MTIKEQRTYLDKAWKVVPLRGTSKTEAARNRRLIKKFVHVREKVDLGQYLRDDAWEDDASGSVKVYLVMNRPKKNENGKMTKWEIAGYFALRTGLLYASQPERIKLERHEELFLELFTKANLLGPSEVFACWAMAGQTIPHRRLAELIDLWRKKQDAYEDRVITQENGTLRVDNVFPAIEITHLCRNTDYQMPEGIDIKFGAYIFWEHIVPKVISVSELVGAQYLYLFAAEENPGNNDGYPSRRLLNMYSNEFNFRLIKDINILKPTYDARCFSMIQEIKDLQQSRIRFWTQKSDE